MKMYKAHQLRTTFGSWDVEKVHAVVARSTFRSQNVQSTPAPDHFWQLRCRKSARRCGAKHISKWKCTKRTTFGPLLEVEMSKKCTPLWCEAHFEVKMYKTHHVWTTFGSWDVEKVHAVVARSTFRSQNVQTLGVRTTFGGSDVVSLHYTTVHYTTLRYTTLQDITLHYSSTLHYTTLHSSTLHYTKLHYTTLHYTTLRSTTLHYTTSHYTTLHYITLYDTIFHYTSLPYTTLHPITLQLQLQLHNYTPLHSTTLNYTTLHYITLHYTTLHSATHHYTTLHYTTLHYTEWHCTTDRQVDRQIDR